MRTLISVAVVMGVIGFLFWKQNSMPKFEGASAGLRTSIWHFEHAKSPKEKAKWAIFENPFTNYDKLIDQAQGTGLSENEIESLWQMKRLKENTIKRILNFYAQLSPEDIRFITQKNPTSPLALGGGFAFPPGRAQDCTEDNIKFLTEKFGLEWMNQNIFPLASYLSAKDAKYGEEYSRQILSLLDSKFTDYQDLIETYFSFGKDDLGENVRVFATQLTDSKDTEDLEQEFRRKLIAAGLQEERLAENLFEVAKNTPGCFQDPVAFYRAFRKIHR